MFETLKKWVNYYWPGNAVEKHEINLSFGSEEMLSQRSYQRDNFEVILENVASGYSEDTHLLSHDRYHEGVSPVEGAQLLLDYDDALKQGPLVNYLLLFIKNLLLNQNYSHENFRLDVWHWLRQVYLEDMTFKELLEKMRFYQGYVDSILYDCLVNRIEKFSKNEQIDVNSWEAIIEALATLLPRPETLGKEILFHEPEIEEVQATNFLFSGSYSRKKAFLLFGLAASGLASFYGRQVGSDTLVAITTHAAIAYGSSQYFGMSAASTIMITTTIFSQPFFAEAFSFQTSTIKSLKNLGFKSNNVMNYQYLSIKNITPHYLSKCGEGIHEPERIGLVGNVVYAAGNQYGVWSCNISNPSDPSYLTSTITGVGPIHSLNVKNDLIVAAGNKGFAVLGGTSSTVLQNCVLNSSVDVINTDGECIRYYGLEHKVYSLGAVDCDETCGAHTDDKDLGSELVSLVISPSDSKLIYIGTQGNGTYVINTADPFDMKIQHRFPELTLALDFAFLENGKFLLAANGKDGVRIYDATNNYNLVSHYTNHPNDTAISLLTATSNISYLCYVLYEKYGIEILNLSNITNPLKIGEYKTGQSSNRQILRSNNCILIAIHSTSAQKPQIRIIKDVGMAVSPQSKETIPNQFATVDKLFDLNISSPLEILRYFDMDLYCTSFNFSLLNQPDWLTFQSYLSSPTIRLYGIPSKEDVGKVNIVLIAANAAGIASNPFQIEITNPSITSNSNHAPEIITGISASMGFLMCILLAYLRYGRSTDKKNTVRGDCINVRNLIMKGFFRCCPDDGMGKPLLRGGQQQHASLAHLN